MKPKFFCNPYTNRHCERAKRAWQNKRSAVSLENKAKPKFL
ncbi:hypothetical protein [Helicobacter macacae]|nr:hypothetical protein [Helicobacter macacae]